MTGFGFIAISTRGFFQINQTQKLPASKDNAGKGTFPIPCEMDPIFELKYNK